MRAQINIPELYRIAADNIEDVLIQFGDFGSEIEAKFRNLDANQKLSIIPGSTQLFRTSNGNLVLVSRESGSPAPDAGQGYTFVSVDNTNANSIAQLTNMEVSLVANLLSQNRQIYRIFFEEYTDTNTSTTYKRILFDQNLQLPNDYSGFKIKYKGQFVSFITYTQRENIATDGLNSGGDIINLIDTSGTKTFPREGILINDIGLVDGNGNSIDPIQESDFLEILFTDTSQQVIATSQFSLVSIRQFSLISRESNPLLIDANDFDVELTRQIGSNKVYLYEQEDVTAAIKLISASISINGRIKDLSGELNSNLRFSGLNNISTAPIDTASSSNQNFSVLYTSSVFQNLDGDSNILNDYNLQTVSKTYEVELRSYPGEVVRRISPVIYNSLSSNISSGGTVVRYILINGNELEQNIATSTTNLLRSNITSISSPISDIPYDNASITLRQTRYGTSSFTPLVGGLFEEEIRIHRINGLNYVRIIRINGVNERLVSGIVHVNGANLTFRLREPIVSDFSGIRILNPTFVSSNSLNIFGTSITPIEVSIVRPTAADPSILTVINGSTNNNVFELASASGDEFTITSNTVQSATENPNIPYLVVFYGRVGGATSTLRIVLDVCPYYITNSSL